MKCLGSKIVYIGAITSDWRGWWIAKFNWSDGLPTYVLYDNHNNIRVQSASLDYVLGWIG